MKIQSTLLLAFSLCVANIESMELQNKRKRAEPNLLSANKKKKQKCKTESSHQEDCFKYLPDELLVNIFGFLSIKKKALEDEKHIASVRRVNKRFWNLITSDNLPVKDRESIPLTERLDTYKKACIYGNIKMVKGLESSYCKGKAKLSDILALYGKTGLIIASALGHEKLVEYLLNNGAEFLPDKLGFSPLDYALAYNHQSIVSLLIKKGALDKLTEEQKNLAVAVIYEDFETIKATLPRITVDNLYVLRIPFFYAVISGKLELVKYFAEYYPCLTSSPFFLLEGSISLPVLTACFFGNYEIAEYLLQTNTSNLDIETFSNIIETGQHKLFASLNNIINLDEILDKLQQRTKAQICLAFSILQAAIAMGNTTIISLFNNYQKSLDFRRPLTPLIYALKANDKKCVQLLLKGNIDLAFTCRDGYSPLYYAIKYSSPELIELLLTTQKQKSNPSSFLGFINAISPDGTTPLMEAILGNNKEAVKLLLRHEASMTIQNPSGYTPLMLAANCGNKDIVQLLLDHRSHSAESYRELKTALNIAQTNFNEEISRQLSRFIEELPASTQPYLSDEAVDNLYCDENIINF